MKKIPLYGVVVLAVLCFGQLWVPIHAQAKKVTAIIGTGGHTGVYYPTGVAIAKIVNRQGGLRLGAESTKGSIRNIEACVSGKRQFGIVQSDWLFKAINGLDFWEKRGPQKDLRAVFSIYPEYVTLIGASDARINTPSDLKGKKVCIGERSGRGLSATIMKLLHSLGLKHEKDIKAVYMKGRETPFTLQEGHIDAFFIIVAHPNRMVKEATMGNRKVNFVSIPVTGDLLKQHPYYVKCKIPISYYPWTANEDDVETVGVMATLITSAKVPDSMVYQVTKSIFENFEEFHHIHPAYEEMTKQAMLEGVTAPWHPGALQYFKEAGLIK